VKQKRITVEQIVAVLKQAEAGVPLAELLRRVGVSEQTFYRWKKQYVGLEVDQVLQLKQLQEENTRLKQVVADLTLDKPCCRMCWQKNSKALAAPADSRIPARQLPGGGDTMPEGLKACQWNSQRRQQRTKFLLPQLVRCSALHSPSD
jgi:putative transposase